MLYCLRYLKSGTEVIVKSFEIDLTKVRQIQQFKYSNTVSAQLQKSKMTFDQMYPYEVGTDKYRIILQQGEEIYIASSEDLTKDTRYTVIEF